MKKAIQALREAERLMRSASAKLRRVTGEARKRIDEATYMDVRLYERDLRDDANMIKDWRLLLEGKIKLTPSGRYEKKAE